MKIKVDFFDGFRKEKYDTVSEVIEAIIAEYHDGGVCVGELLDQIRIKGLQISDVIRVAATVRYMIEGDEMILVSKDADGDEIEKRELFQTPINVPNGFADALFTMFEKKRG
jgi:hypothetical protein